MIADSSKPNKLQNVYHEKHVEELHNQRHRVYHKILEETNPYEIERCKSKKAASVSVVLVLFNCTKCRWINLIDHAFKIRIFNVQKIIEV